MGFTYIRNCTMACWTGGERQGMGVKSILAFLLRLGHALHWSGEGNIFQTETDTGVVCLGSVKYVLWHKLKKNIVSFPPWEWRICTSCWRKRVGSPISSRRPKMGGGLWLSMVVLSRPARLQSKDNKWKPHSTLAAGGVVSDFRKVKEGDGHWSRWNLFVIWTLLYCLILSSICWFK